VLVFPMPERLVERLVAGSHAQGRVTKTMSGSSVMVGIDVASEHVDVAVIGAELPASLRRVSNDPEGHSALAEGLVRLAPGLVLMEATGGYEAALACALQAAGLRVAVTNPRMARDFARAMQRLANRGDGLGHQAPARRRRGRDGPARRATSRPDVPRTSGWAPLRSMSSRWMYIHVFTISKALGKMYTYILHEAP